MILLKVEIESKEKNPLMHRLEIGFVVENASKTPSRAEIREKLAALLNAKPDCLILSSLKHEFGTMQVFGKAKVYDNAEILERIELKKFKRKNFPERFVKKEETKE